MDPRPLSQVIDLSSKVVVVTGGARGIGLGIAYRLAEAGAAVVIADRDKVAADSAAANLAAKGWKVTALAADVADATQVEALINAVVAAYGGIDILVNNAGIYPNVPVMQMSEKDFEHIISVNLKGGFLCSKAAAAQMIKQGRGGRIINISSIDALHPSMIGLAAYDASKHGVWGFTKSLALELAPEHIWVNAIAPGSISTPGTGTLESGVQAVAAGFTDDVRKAFLEKIPMRRMGDADEIGKVALFLASDLSSYMTGSQIVVDGGVLLS